jgi:hypothetical protein
MMLNVRFDPYLLDDRYIYIYSTLLLMNSKKSCY